MFNRNSSPSSAEIKIDKEDAFFTENETHADLNNDLVDLDFRE